MTRKQKRFVEEYLVDLNATQAAIRAGYSEKTAFIIGAENLKKPYIKGYIEERLDELKSKNIADAKEVMEYLTSVMRGNEIEEVVLEGSKEIIDKKPNIKDRIRAAELLGKRFGMFKEKLDIQRSVPIIIKEDIDE